MLKKLKKSGLCRLFNQAPGDCPYDTDCIFVHICSKCGAMDEDGAMVCSLPPRPNGSSWQSLSEEAGNDYLATAPSMCVQ